MSIFCDGACSGNGRKGAVGGWGWAYWAGPIRGEPTAAAADRLDVPPGLPATNQRAELTALLKVLRWLAAATPAVTSIDIYTDSMYTINCTSTWGPAWKKAGWKRKTGEPLLNLDLIVPLVELWRPGWRLHHVRGHQTNSSPQAYGNNWVDQAAVAGAEGKVLSPSSFSLPVASPSPVVTSASATVVKGSALPATLTLAQAKQTDIRLWFS
jgi:ribonuclease HI